MQAFENTVGDGARSVVVPSAGWFGAPRTRTIGASMEAVPIIVSLRE